MFDWRRAFAQVAITLQEQFDTTQLHLKQRFNLLDPIIMLPYRGHGNHTDLYLKGRVLEQSNLVPPKEQDTVWDNILNMYARAFSNEITGAEVLARFQGQSYTAFTDRDGYFNLHISPSAPLDLARIWHPVDLELIAPKAQGQEMTTARAEILIPPPQAAFGVISDIDDTVVQTNATDLFKMARTVLLNNAYTRIPFAGIAAFYRALQAGPTGAGYNPIFYISSSAWNLYDLFTDFFALHDIPTGPLFLRDYHIDDQHFIRVGHAGHKLERIRPLLDTYPQLPFVLIGDSGQEDPEIYREVVRSHGQQIRMIYIRDVTGVERHQTVQKIAAEVQNMGVAMVLVADTIAAAEHAVAEGLIAPEALPSIQADQRKDAQVPAAMEEVLLAETPAQAQQQAAEIARNRT